MIVRPNGSYEISGLFPSSNWYDSEPENHVVDENTEQGLALAQKIVANYPNYTLVITDGKLVDVNPTDPPPPVEPEPPAKTPEQLRIEALEAQVAQQESDNVDLMLAVTDLYEQVQALQGGTP